MIPVMVTRFTLTLKKAIVMDSDEDEDPSSTRSFTARPPSHYTDGGSSLLHSTDLETTRARVGLPSMFADVGHHSALDSV
jgi:hypothetical protein